MTGKRSRFWLVLTLLAVTALLLSTRTSGTALADTPSGKSPEGAPAIIQPPLANPNVPMAWNLTEGFDVMVPVGWTAQNNSVPVGTTGWFQGNSTVFPAHSGAVTSYAGANFNNTTGANTISNWLISPLLTIDNGDTWSFWTRKVSPDTFPDRLQAYISTNGTCSPGTGATSTGAFTNLLVDINPTLVTGVYPTEWTNFTGTISGLPSSVTGCFAFRYFVTNGGPSGANSDYIGVDTLVLASSGGPTATPTATATNTPAPTSTATATNTAVATSTATATNTAVPPTATATATTPAGSQVVTYCSTFAPISVVDNQPTTFVTGTLTIPAAAQILDANVRISMTHTWVGDLIFRLSNGTTSTIIVDRPGFTGTGAGCSANNIDDSFVDDEGTDGTWESSCVNVTTQTPAYPAGSRLIGGGIVTTGNPTLMTVYDGGSTAGTWTLAVSDNAAGDTGTLNQFCMEFLVPAGATATPTATNTPDPTPTATASNTAVPTNTATATNTPTGPTNTPTASATPGGGGNRFCSSTPITIPDANPTGATGTITVGSAGTISDLNVIITGTHTWVGDVRLNLSNGTTNVTFYDQPGVPASTFGCSGDNLPGVVGDDEGVNGSFENSCQNATPAYTPGGSYTNNNALSAFDGSATNATWTLTASDLAAGDTGTIDSWCVEFGTGAGPTPTATATPTSPAQVPDINVNPSSFNETHSSPPQTTTDTLNIQNVGSGTLTWTIAEDDTATDWVPSPLVPSANSVETAADGGAPAPATSAAPVGKPGYVPGMNGGVLYDNGPLVNVPGGGAGGADASRLQDASLLLSTYGFGHALSTGFRVADDFTVPAGETWTINSVTFFAYQTGSTTTSTINNVNVRIWDGPPGVGSIVFGDTTTNRLATSTWSNAYRDLESAPGDASRPVMANTATVSTVLTAGTYWIDWQTGGTLGSGPWAPPISINGTAVTGNAVQFDPGTSTWNAAIDTGAAAQQGFPFIIEGTGGGGGGACSAPTDIPWLTVSPLNGSTSGGGSTPVTLTYNSTSLAQGTYTGTLCVASNDPDEALVTVPITLNVGLPTAIDLASFTSPMSGFNPADLAAAGLLLLAGAVLVLRRK